MTKNGVKSHEKPWLIIDKIMHMQIGRITTDLCHINSAQEKEH